MQERKIKALMVAPYDLPRAVLMPVTIKSFRKAVSVGAEEYGDVRARKVDDNIYALYHRFGCFAGLEGNRKVNGRIISGVFYIVGADKHYYPRSLTSKELERYMSMFWDIPDFDSIDVVRSQIKSFEDELGQLEEYVNS